MTTQTSPKTTEHENIVPLHSMSMFENMERMFDNFVPTNWIHPFKLEQSLRAESLPQVDVIEQDSNILVRASLPGVKKEDLEVSTTDD